MDDSDVDADPNLRERLERRIVNNNETILKIDLLHPNRYASNTTTIRMST